MESNSQCYSGLQFCTFNCRSVKNCIPELRNLCDINDIVFLQEHWLLPDELHLLNNIHPDYFSYGLSAVDISRDILVGRPYGGTAILYRKNLADKLTVVHSSESRITSILIDTVSGPILFINVYMPTNYGDDHSLEQYVDCLCKLQATIVDVDAVHVFIAGDFNCDTNSRFYHELCNFMTDNGLLMCDKSRLNNVYTYISDNGCNCSWIDHILSTASLDSLITHMRVLDDVIVSDHKPVSCYLQCNVLVNKCSSAESLEHSSRVPHWTACNDSTHYKYEIYLDNALKMVDIPVEVLNRSFDVDVCKTRIDKFYCEIVDCVKVAVSSVIPTRQCHYNSEFNVPGWNTYVREKHDVARDAYRSWVLDGKPKYGYSFDCMKRTRAVFKLAVRYCKNNIEQMKADACAEGLIDNDCHKFWRNVYKISNNRATNFATCVGGSSGVKDVTEMWKEHFATLYSSSVDNGQQSVFETKIANKLCEVECTAFTVLDVINVMKKMKLGKCPGPDGIHMEALHYGGKRLCTLLCLLFNMCMKTGYLPSQLMSAVIVPLVKCKTGDLSDVDNYRAITLSNSISKIIESLLFEIIETVDDIDDYQFGFQKGVSTAMCTDVFKSTVDYYRRNGSHVFCCFIDFKKAFDRVDYWLLFCKLVDSNNSELCCAATRLLAFWYSHQQVFVRWQNTYSRCFNLARGVRQGGILSPYLFKLYVRDLLKVVVKSCIGCNIAGWFINILAYADDMVLLAPSWRGLQCLLDIIDKAAVDIDMSFNTKKRYA